MLTWQNKLDITDSADSGVYVRDLTSYVVKSTRECDKLRDFGAKNRHVGATAMNQDSSRSHSLYTITVESCETRDDGSSSIRMGKLNLVDLAGSERAAQTGATGARLKEGANINTSLMFLGQVVFLGGCWQNISTPWRHESSANHLLQVIGKLSSGEKCHVNYRDSKLTRLAFGALRVFLMSVGLFN